MEFPADEIDELRRVYSNVQMAEEGGYTYFLLPYLDLPDGCIPTNTDALFCAMPRDGYTSRLYFSDTISGCPQRNWNGQARILDRNWHAISWKVNPSQRLIQLIRSHLDAFRL